uniref:Uncharacterized protein n=1 Tax=Anopheles coluzzii TaxID=1518534 RepID=A0A8W7PMQ6_ANOCL
MEARKIVSPFPPKPLVARLSHTRWMNSKDATKTIRTQVRQLTSSPHLGKWCYFVTLFTRFRGLNHTLCPAGRNMQAADRLWRDYGNLILFQPIRKNRKKPAVLILPRRMKKDETSTTGSRAEARRCIIIIRHRHRW